MSTPSQQFFNAPFDPSGYTSIDGAQLLQLIDGLMLFSDKGCVIVTTAPAIPDGNTYANLTTCIWLQINTSSSSIAVYAWNPNGVQNAFGSGMQLWAPINVATIGPGTITGTMIAANTITFDKIVSVAASSLFGSLPASILATLVQNVQNPYINPSTSLNQGQIQGSFQTGLTIVAASVTNGQILGSGTINQFLTTNSGSPTTVSWLTYPPLLMTLSETGIASAQNKAVLVNSAGNGYTYGGSGTVVAGATLASGVTSLAHGLGVRPKIYQAIVLCTTNDSNTGYIVGDEIQIQCLAVFATPSFYNSIVSVYADATNINIALGTVSGISLPVKSTGSPAGVSSVNNFKFKAYFLPF